YLYSFNKACGVTLTELPLLNAYWVKRPTTPSFAELRGVADARYVSDDIIHEARDHQPAMGVYISVEAFREYCGSLRDVLKRHERLYVLEEHMRARGQIEGMLQRFWHQPPCDLGEGQTYHDWFFVRGLDFESLNPADFEILANDLL